MNKLIVILGPTSSGKSSLAIKLAKKFNGEIVSADSRQVYKGLDIGTGKVPISYGGLRKTSTKSSIPSKDGIYSGGIRHHLLNVASPKRQYTVANFKHDIKIAIDKIMSENKLPFLVGGTAFYIYAVIDNLKIPEVKPNLKFRKKLEKKTAAELFKLLKKLDPVRAKSIDPRNPRRLIRAIEINLKTGRPVPPSLNPSPQGGGKIKIPPLRWGRLGRGGQVLIIGIKKSPEELKKIISKRVDERLNHGLINEVKKLLRSGVSAKRLAEIGLIYRLTAEYVISQKKSIYKNGRSAKIVYNQLRQKIKTAEQQYARRQMTWFKRDKRIHWIKNQKQAERLIIRRVKY